MQSVCIFGSEARQTADEWSDRDVLILCGSPKRLRKLSADWTGQGWNVSAFKISDFQRLARTGSLFVQHVKQEGKVIVDDGNSLQKVLKSYAPKLSYVAERNDALTQIINLPSLDGFYWHDLCVADIASVLFRNAMILHLASKGYYCFEFSELVRLAVGELALSNLAGKSLLNLRKLKRMYRERMLGGEVSAAVEATMVFAQNMLSTQADSNVSAIAEGLTSDRYMSIRLAELQLVSQQDIFKLDNLTEDDDLYDAWRAIRSSGGYTKEKSQVYVEGAAG